MALEFVSPGESFVTNAAAEADLPRVASHVLGQVAPLRELASAHGAAEQVLFSEASCVALQSVAVAESFVALRGAAAWFLPAVRAHVLDQVFVDCVFLPAHRAAERFPASMFTERSLT